jgi:outer membrane lipoprotein-sorting protein
MKKIILSILALFIATALVAQPAGSKLLSSTEKATTVQKLKNNSTNLKTLKVDFSQEKTSKLFTDKVVSKGNMAYKKSNMLRWSYTSPKKYAIILNKKGAFFKNEKGSVQNKMIEGLCKLLLRTINGDGLVENNGFAISYYRCSDGSILALMKPTDKTMKEIYTSLEVYLDATTLLAKKVKLNEKKGDVTTITFSNHKKDIAIADSEFDE